MDSNARRKKVVIVGAGVGGVAIAARLARAGGVQVSLYEKNTFLGGKCSNITHNGFRFDQGPSLMLMPEIYEETFRQLGTSMQSEGIELFKCEPNCNVWFDDGQCFTLSTDLAQMKREVEKWEGKGTFERYLAFLQESCNHYEKSVVHVLRKDFPRLVSLLRPSFLPYIFQLHPFHTVWQRASHFFETRRLRQVFSLGSLYLGMSPFQASGIYTLLQYAELAEGVWYPRGGLHQIIQALANVGQTLGVEYHYPRSVKRVAVSSHGKATGVELDSGEDVDADVVVVNADLVYAYRELVPPSRYEQKLSKRELSCSSISFYWSLSETIPQLETHGMFPGESHGSRSAPIHLEYGEPCRPTFYVHVPSRTDPSAGPPGKDAVIVLVLIDHMKERESETNYVDMDKVVSEVRQYVISSIEWRTGAVGFGRNIEHEMVNTPIAWHDKFNAERGAIFGLNHNFFNLLSFRPNTRHDTISNLYFVGASTHPGAGVPTCLAGAKLTAERILADLDIQIPWNIQEPGPTESSQRVLLNWPFQFVPALPALCIIFPVMVFIIYIAVS